MSSGRSGLKAPTRVAKPAIPKSLSGSSASAESPPARPDDDFIIGDRVYVGGTKPGHIAYIGETKFAAGDWAGVVLDDPVGKNDGSVFGIQYFQCEPMKGVFARVSKLRREPSDKQTASPALSSPGVVKPGSRSLGMKKSISQSENMSPHGSMGSLCQSDPGHEHGKIRLGDRVLVSGTKKGKLRYLGVTEFARGEWAGVELDDPLGKNDGSVAGKRYFSCKPLYGLFAPSHKVAKISAGDASTPIRASMMENRIALGLTRDNSGSQDSISSIGSSASSVSRSRVRLGVTSLNSPKKTAQRPAKSAQSTSASALQKALREKEDHIEQLLKERDMERSEVARAAAQVDETEGRLLMLKNEHEKFIAENDENMVKLKALVQDLEFEKTELVTQLEEEKRKVEDLQFRMEEEEINKEDIEEKSGVDSARLVVIEKSLREEREKSTALAKKLETLKPLYEKAKLEQRDAEDNATAHLDKIEELSHTLHTVNDKVRLLEEGRQNSQATVVNDLEEKVRTISAELEQSRTEFKALKGKLDEGTKRFDAQLSEVDDLKQKLEQERKESESLRTERGQMQSELATINKDSSKANSVLTGKVSELTTSLHNAQAKSQQLEEKNRQESYEVKKMQEMVDEKERMVKSLTDSLESKTNEIMTSSLTTTDLQAEVNDLKSRCKAKDQSLEDIQSKLSASDQKYEHLTDVKTKLEQEMMDLMKNSGDSASQYLGKLEQMSHNLKEAEGKINILEEGKRASTIEMKRMTDSLTEKDGAIKGLEQCLEEKAKEVMSSSVELSDVQTSSSKLESKCKEMEESVRDTETNLFATRNECEGLREDKKRLEAELSGLMKNADDKATETGTRMEELLRKLEESKKRVVELDLRDKSQSGEIGRLTEVAAEREVKMAGLEKSVQEKEELEGVRQILVKLKDENAELEKALAGIKTTLEAKESAYDQLMSEKSKLESNLSNMVKANNSSYISDLESQVQERAVELEGMQSVLTRYVKKLAAVYDSLGLECGNSVGMVSLLAADKGVPTQQMEDVVRGLEAQVAEARTMIGERKNLLNRINELESRPNGVTTEDSKQVDFLNSVIVDLQRKNCEMQAKLEILETGSLYGGSNHSSTSPVVRKSSAPRLFCDICEEFDVHDTEDCPRQTMSDCDVPSRRLNSSRGSVGNNARPYCDTCEMFGHSTDECNDDQTF